MNYLVTVKEYNPQNEKKGDITDLMPSTDALLAQGWSIEKQKDLYTLSKQQKTFELKPYEYAIISNLALYNLQLEHKYEHAPTFLLTAKEQEEGIVKKVNEALGKYVHIEKETKRFTQL